MACEKSADASLAPPRHAWQQMSAAQPLVFPCAHYMIKKPQIQKNKPIGEDCFSLRSLHYSTHAVTKKQAILLRFL